MKATALLRRKILSQSASIAVVGQGYVGLSLASAAAEAGFKVTGIDVDQTRIDELNDGGLSVPGVSEGAFRTAIESERLTFTTDPAALGDCGIVFICVPTPVSEGTPDLTYVKTASKTVGAHLAAGSMVVLESTTYPGTTDGPVKEALETGGLMAGKDFLLAYSPERIDPGNAEFTFRSVPRVVGGMTPEATGLAALFYGQLVDKVVEMSSCRAAELAKLLENTFRHVNIALVNEVAMICNETGEDVWEVIHAAATKPYGFMPFFPGPGVGGHCIPVDPAYLAWQVRRDAGVQFRILEQAQDVNARMPAYVATRISDALNDAGKAMKGASILVLGVAYKPDVGDTRESPSLAVMDLLQKRSAKVSFHDPFAESLHLNGGRLDRSELTLRAVKGADLVALLTPHSTYDLAWLADNAALIFDARNAYNGQKNDNVVRL